MISTQRLSVSFGSQTLFEEVDAKFTPGNCYGLIGANGAGKSTFLKCLAGKIEPTAGSVNIPPDKRLSMLSQDHFAFNEVPALTTVIMGHKKLFEIMSEKDALYAKPDFSEADGTRAGELEAAFADLNGWDAESEAAKLLSELGITADKHNLPVKELSDSEKVRVLMAQALFGNPDILLLDEPTNHLDVDSILWLEEFLLNFKNTVVVVSHDRHFLDKVCTHIADIDFGKVTLYSGNYTFWYETSQMALTQRSAANKKKEEQIKDLKTFIARFSANASKSRQASSRRNLLDKITLDDIRPSSRKYPFIQFKTERVLGKEVLTVDKLSKSIGGEVMFKNLSFSIGRGERVAVVGDDRAVSALLSVLAGEMQPDSGTMTWGRSVHKGYFPKDSNQYFTGEKTVLEWLRQYCPEGTDESFIRSFLGRMLFSGDDAHKKVKVLSGGERVRCMFSRLMLQDPNTLLLDQPTNHLDLESITALNNGLLKTDSSMMFSCHDVQFMESLAQRVIELDGEKYYDMHMTYEEYLANPARLARVGRGLDKLNAANTR
ncbi:MAG: ATP-binding cassette domain-containing protein [Deltaproteobacteria bacterium]|nr:ATP-binding cassette domain-containing protein [Deltaproteobacteria bacterium]